MPGDPGPTIAAGGAAPTAAEADALDEIVAPLAGEAAERLRGVAARPAVAEAEAAALAEVAAAALHGRRAEVEAGEDPAMPGAAELLEAARRLQAADAGTARYSDDFSASRNAAQSGVRAAGLADFLDPRNILRVFTVYQMKDRAGTVGAAGVRALLLDLLTESATQVHAAGHSYGAKVMLSAACAGAVPRPLDFAAPVAAGRVASVLRRASAWPAGPGRLPRGSRSRAGSPADPHNLQSSRPPASRSLSPRCPAGRRPWRARRRGGNQRGGAATASRLSAAMARAAPAKRWSIRFPVPASRCRPRGRHG